MDFIKQLNDIYEGQLQPLKGQHSSHPWTFTEVRRVSTQVIPGHSLPLNASASGGKSSELSPGVVLSYGPCSYLFSFAAHHPKRLAPLQPKSIYIFDIGRQEWLPDPIEGLGDVLLQPQYQHGVEPFLFQMDGNKLASVWCHPYFPIAQQSQPSTDQPISSVLQSSHDIGSKTRKRPTLVHPDILENAALEKFDGVDKHVSKKLQVDKLSQVSSALSTTRLQEFVSAHNEAVKKLQDEAEKPKELNSSLMSKLKDSVERDSKSLVKLFAAYYLEGFKDCKAKGQILCPHAEWDEVQPNQLED